MSVMFIDHPGAGKLRAMSLDEYMSPLIPEHPAREELAAIRAKALEGAKAIGQVMELLDELKVLKQKLADLTEPPPLPESSRAEALAEKAGIITWPKKPCPVCGKEVSSCPGPWASHMKGKHPTEFANGLTNQTKA